MYKSLNLISELNNTGYRINNLPYLNKGRLIAELVHLPKLLLFVGECGEYELLFTVNPKDEQEFLDKTGILKSVFSRVGVITAAPEKTVVAEGKSVDMGKLNISARDYPDRKEYLRQLTGFLEKQ
jgi:thiamine-monophosphate kinase